MTQDTIFRPRILTLDPSPKVSIAAFLQSPAQYVSLHQMGTLLSKSQPSYSLVFVKFSEKTSGVDFAAFNYSTYSLYSPHTWHTKNSSSSLTPSYTLNIITTMSTATTRSTKWSDTSE